MKKNYCKPTMNVVKIQHQQTLLAGSVDSVNSGDTGIGFGQRSGWDDWDE